MFLIFLVVASITLFVCCLWNSVLRNHVGCYKVRNLSRSQGGIWRYFHPFNEVINGYQGVSVAIGPLGGGLIYYVNSSHREWPL